jgi:hypothetical protein
LTDSLTRTVLALLLLAPAGLSIEFYVAAVSGDNANSGTTPLLAWKTISHASSSGGGGATIHVAPGLYDGALGDLWRRHRLRGIRWVWDLPLDASDRDEWEWRLKSTAGLHFLSCWCGARSDRTGNESTIPVLVPRPERPWRIRMQSLGWCNDLVLAVGAVR